MAGAFSGHLLQTFQAAQHAMKGPFGQSSSMDTNLSIHGSMSFAPTMHGTFPIHPSFFQDTTLVDVSDETAKKIASLQAKLDKKLGPEYISQRPGPGGGPKLTYAEGWKIINLANEVFGFNGWSSQVVSMTTDFIDCNEQSQRFSVGVTAIVRVTLRDGVFHEDVGYGLLENSRSKGAALDKCKKEAVTDAVKRTLRNFGNLLGNCLYDKSYTQEVVKMKVPPPKFNKDDLHRRPEFEATKPPAPAAGPSKATHTSAPSKPPTTVTRPASPVVKSESTSRMEAIMNACNAAAQEGQDSPLAAPPRTRSESGQQGPVAVSTPHVKGNTPLHDIKPKIESVSAGAVQSRGGSGLVAPPNLQVHHRSTDASSTTGTVVASSRDHLAQQRHANPPQQGERRVSFAPQSVASSSTAISAGGDPAPPPPPAAIEVDVEVDIPDDASDFLFNSDDDAFLAQVDLGEEGLGGPIDFDEGAGAVEVGEESRVEVHAFKQLGGPPPQGWGHPPLAQQPTESRAARAPQPPQRHAVPTSTSASASASHRQQFTNAGNTTHSSVPLAQSPPAMGGFHYPSANSTSKPSTTNAAHHAAPARGAAQPSYSSAGPGGSTIGMKRSADVMQGNAASRRPMQGMGLAPPPGRPQGAGAQHRREPFSTLEVGEGGDVKRMRR